MSDSRQDLTDADLAKFEAIVKQHAQAAAKTISEEFKRSAPKPTSPWFAGLSIVAATAAVIGAMALLVSKDDEKTTALLAKIDNSVIQNTQAIGDLRVTFARLDQNVGNLNKNFDGLLIEIKGQPSNGAGHGVIPSGQD